MKFDHESTRIMEPTFRSVPVIDDNADVIEAIDARFARRRSRWGVLMIFALGFVLGGAVVAVVCAFI